MLQQASSLSGHLSTLSTVREIVTLIQSVPIGDAKVDPSLGVTANKLSIGHFVNILQTIIRLGGLIQISSSRNLVWRLQCRQERRDSVCTSISILKEEDWAGDTHNWHPKYPPYREPSGKSRGRKWSFEATLAEVCWYWLRENPKLRHSRCS